MDDWDRLEAEQKAIQEELDRDDRTEEETLELVARLLRNVAEMLACPHALPEIGLDQMPADVDGVVTVEVSALPADTRVDDWLVVGDDSKRHVAVVTEIRPDLATLQILPDDPVGDGPPGPDDR